MVGVSWTDAAEFCRWLSRKEHGEYRLPTEAEWEYACRAGTTTRYHNGDDPEALVQVANVADATAKGRFPTYYVNATDGFVFTAPVGLFRPNAFGLYDMHGNASQWCADWYGGYTNSPVDDPTGPKNGDHRVQRGGSYFSRPDVDRSARRNGYAPDYNTPDAGFRVLGVLKRQALVERAKGEQSAEGLAATNRFIVGYCRPIYRFIRRPCFPARRWPGQIVPRTNSHYHRHLSQGAREQVASPCSSPEGRAEQVILTPRAPCKARSTTIPTKSPSWPPAAA